MKKLIVVLPLLLVLTGCLTVKEFIGVRPVEGTDDYLEVYKKTPTALGRMLGLKEREETVRIHEESAWDKLVDLLQLTGTYLIWIGLGLIIVCVGIAFAFHNRAFQGLLGGGAVIGVLCVGLGGGTYLLSDPWVFGGFMFMIVLLVIFGTHFMFSHKDTSAWNSSKNVWEWAKNKVRERAQNE